ncbi:hypothetical protein F5148DRAFT_879965 [Russula earlei]|uniref:Uncharacterized protein n=1 Tax=Russula earlei TaxID=71964 RepID=A0ACC0UAD9_9AGAM|nr:hypothetical protein F5148DRAFT_879965 [Russula earlei]
MSGDQAKSTTSGAEQVPHPPALPQYPPQPFPGAPYPPPPGAYTWYYPSTADPNGDPGAPPPGPFVMFPPPGIMYGYPPPPTPAQGYGAFSTPAPAVVTRAKRKQVKMACTNCATACKRCDEARPCQRCQKYGLADSCVDGVRKARKVGIKRGPYKRKSKLSAPETSPYPGFPPNGEGSWAATSDQTEGAPPGATPAIPPQYLPPEGYWPYPYYPAPPGYVPPPSEGHANGDGATHGQPPHHPAYYPIHPGYPAMPMYPPPGAYGPIPTSSGQVPPAPPTEPTAGNQTATSDDERPTVERPKKKRRAGGEDSTSKSGKKSKRAANPSSEAPAAATVTPVAPPSEDSPDDHGSPVAHNRSGSVGEPLPPVIAAA